MQKPRSKKTNNLLATNDFESSEIFDTKSLENQISSNFPTKARSVMSYSSDNKYSYLNQRLNESNKCFYPNELNLNEKTSTSSKRHTVSNMRHQNYLTDAYHYSSRY